MIKVSLITLIIAAVIPVNFASNVPAVPEFEWNSYKATFKKAYDSPLTESIARLNYATNRNIIQVHNALYKSGYFTYGLAINQFSDMSFIRFANMFRPAVSSSYDGAKPPPKVQKAPGSFDPREYGFILNIENQGTKCSSGWAYAAAKSIELFKAYRTGNKSPKSLSAQNFIDCAGSWIGCTNQKAQAAFDYLTQYNRSLNFESDYNNNNSSNKPNMCTPPANPKAAVTLKAYSKIKYGDYESLRSYVSAGMPVVVEFNPSSFHFMHYSEGILTERLLQFPGSHFMVVIGYGTDSATNKNYWLLQNSFGSTWGEGGVIRVEHSQITKNAIFPSQ